MSQNTSCFILVPWTYQWVSVFQWSSQTPALYPKEYIWDLVEQGICSMNVHGNEILMWIISALPYLYTVYGLFFYLNEKDIDTLSLRFFFFWTTLICNAASRIRKHWSTEAYCGIQLIPLHMCLRCFLSVFFFHKSSFSFWPGKAAFTGHFLRYMLWYFTLFGSLIACRITGPSGLCLSAAFGAACTTTWLMGEELMD